MLLAHLRLLFSQPLLLARVHAYYSFWLALFGVLSFVGFSFSIVYLSWNSLLSSLLSSTDLSILSKLIKSPILSRISLSSFLLPFPNGFGSLMWERDTLIYSPFDGPNPFSFCLLNLNSFSVFLGDLISFLCTLSTIKRLIIFDRVNYGIKFWDKKYI